MIPAMQPRMKKTTMQTWGKSPHFFSRAGNHWKRGDKFSVPPMDIMLIAYASCTVNKREQITPAANRDSGITRMFRITPSLAVAPIMEIVAMIPPALARAAKRMACSASHVRFRSFHVCFYPSSGHRR